MCPFNRTISHFHRVIICPLVWDSERGRMERGEEEEVEGWEKGAMVMGTEWR